MIILDSDSPAVCVAANARSMAARFAALSHPARLDILRHLAGRPACCCKDVVERLDLAQSTVSQHLKILVDAGLVRYAPDKQRSRYEIDREALTGLEGAFGDFVAACLPDRR